MSTPDTTHRRFAGSSPARTPLARPLAALALGLTTALVAGPARADFIWDGAVDNDWNTAGNWDIGVPMDPVGLLTFGLETDGTLDYTVTMANSMLSGVTGITFTADAGAYDISGTGSLTLDTNAIIVNFSSNTQTIDIDLVASASLMTLLANNGDIVMNGDIDLSAGVVLTVTGIEDVTIGGLISGGASGRLSKSGAGTLTLLSANTYSGTSSLAGGRIILGDALGLGTGALEITGAGTLESNANMTVANAVNLVSSTLTIDGAFDLELSGDFSGAGSLAKAGAGTLTLTGTSTGTGAVTVSEGVLRVDNGDAIGDAANVVLADAAGATFELLAGETIGGLSGGGATGGTVALGANTLTVDTSGTTTFSGALTGAGVLAVTGSGTLNLDGTSTFSGGTTLGAGGATLGLGSDGALGGGTLTISQDATINPFGGERTIANAISLSAAQLTISGADTATFSGAVDLMGGTRSLDVTNTAGVDFSGVISNGSLTKIGSGVLTLSGANTYAGDTNIDAGELSLTGSITGAANINDGGLLTGTGTVGGILTNGSGGTLDTGTAGTTGTLNVSGNYVQEAGSTFAVDVNASDGSSDLLQVAGTASLASGSTIDATIASAEFITTGQTWTILTASGGITDDGVTVTTESATMDFLIQRNGDFENGDTSFLLQAFRAPTAFEDAALTGNNRQMGRSLDSLVAVANADPGGGVAQMIGQLDTFNQFELNVSMIELSPERHNAGADITFSGATAYNVTQARYMSLRRLGLDTIAQQAGLQSGSLAGEALDPAVIAAAIAAQDEANLEATRERDRTGLWVQGFGFFTNLDPSDERSGYDSNSFGGQAGLDHMFTPDFLGGISVAFTTTTSSANRSGGDLDVDTVRFGPYLSFHNDDGWFVEGSVTGGISSYDSNRSVPTLGLSPQSDYDGWDIVGFAQGGFEWELNNVWTFVTSFGLQYAYLDVDGFTESGGGGANLSVDGRTTDSLVSRLEAGFVTRPGDGELPAFIDFRLGWQREYLDNDSISGTFAAGGLPFIIATGPREVNTFTLGLGGNWLINANTSAFVRYDGTLNTATNTNVISGGFSFRF